MQNYETEIIPRRHERAVASQSAESQAPLQQTKKLQFASPVSGPKLAITEVPDPVFSQKMVGDGIAIDPTDQVLLAPCNGKIIQLHSSHHAVTVESPDGVKVLLHIGLDTVNLKGEGFFPKVKVGDTVQMGQPLIEFDADLIAQKAKSLITVVVMAEAPGGRILVNPSPKLRAGKDIAFKFVVDANQKSTAAKTESEENKKENVGRERQEKQEGKEPQSQVVTSDLIKVDLPAGFHARPAGQLAAKAKEFEGKIQIAKGLQKANAKSLVDIMSLDIAKGDEILIKAEGEGGQKAVTELTEKLQELTQQEINEQGSDEKSAQTVRKNNESQTENSVPGLQFNNFQINKKMNFSESSKSETATVDPVLEKNQKLREQMNLAGRDSTRILRDAQDRLSKASELSRSQPELGTPIKEDLVKTVIPAKPFTFEEENSKKIPTGELKGVSASSGIAVGRVHQLREMAYQIPETGMTIEQESLRLEKSLQLAKEELVEIQNTVKERADESKAAIFAAHQELLEDPSLVDNTIELIDQGKSAAFAWNRVYNEQADRLSGLNNELMAARAADLRDVGERVLQRILGIEKQKTTFDGETILVAEDLSPSDTAQLDREKVIGFCTINGGATSHVAILARSLGIPAIAGIDRRALELENGTEVIIDGDKGILKMSPTEAERNQIQNRQAELSEKKRQSMEMSQQPAFTLDGHMVEVAANIGGVSDSKEAASMGCDAVGLLRSEFLFLSRTTAPTEDEQLEVYQQIADQLGPQRPLTIRTLDVGGDKPLQYLPIEKEENPYLGERGIRVGLRRKDIFREQLRAILRVQTQAEIRIMFPMIASVEEWREAKAIFDEERSKIEAKNVSVGIMIEVPSAAILADVLAREVDFFSIGTNDLTQYTLAVDRGHKLLASKCDGLHPSVLRLINMTVKAAHNNSKPVAVCGGIASDERAIPILVGLGVDELSVSTPTLPLIKSQIREISLKECQNIAIEAMRLANGDEVRAMLSEKGLQA